MTNRRLQLDLALDFSVWFVVNYLGQAHEKLTRESRQQQRRSQQPIHLPRLRDGRKRRPESVTNMMWVA